MEIVQDTDNLLIFIVKIVNLEEQMYKTLVLINP
ncbi:MAG: hypothetical protein ACJAZ6_002148 [Oleispira sp.]